MHRQPPKSARQPQPSPRLVVRGERRAELDWDTFIAALLAYALRDPDSADDSSKERDD